MPTTRRRESASAAAEQSHGESESQPLLRFNEPLSWKAGKAIPIADLLARLQKLTKELRGLQPDGEVDPKSVFKVAQELAGHNLLAHKDRGVRAWAMCCVVDLLRICEPHAPFRNSQLKDIFNTIVNSIIPPLADPSNAYNAQHIYVLSSLAKVQSIALITDVDRPEQLILSLFISCFDIVSGSSKASTGEEVNKAVEAYLTQILVEVIDQSSSIAPEITDVIIAQFMRADPRTEENNASMRKKNAEVQDGSQSSLLQKTYPRAYEMAKAICVSVPEKMTTFVSQYFNNVIVDAAEPAQTNGHPATGHGGRGSGGDADEEAKGLKELSKAHRLIRELWRACPDVLQHVIPQVEAELSAESPSLRLIATETLGDVAAGIGVAGCPPPTHTDPAAYPPQSLSSPVSSTAQTSVLQTPMSSKPFGQVHASAYENFLSRKQDRSSSVRAAWATSAGRILLTSAGGIGFAEGEEQKLKTGLAQLLADADEKVRLAAIKAIGSFGFAEVIGKLGPHGSISSRGSVLATLSDRVRDRKHFVRVEATHVLGRMWAAAAGEIEQGNVKVASILGDAPSKLLDAYYVNDPEVHVLLDQVIYDYLLPLDYPRIKRKTSKSESQKQLAKGKSDHQEDDGTDTDLIRVRRILTFIRGLDDKARTVFFGMQNRQTQLSRIMAQYLKACEDYNGGVVDKDEAEIQKELTKWVEVISKTLPESTRVSADLRKFAKLHDRRNYQLIRFCLNPESEYRTVVKAIKELTKRIQARPTNSPSLDTLSPLLSRCSLLVYSRSHVHGIMRISRNDENGLAETAHELLKEMSTRTPEVLKTHVQELCKDLQSTAPNESDPEEPSAADMLKACAEFTRKFPAEIPGDRKFMMAMANYALFSQSPRAAKHAASIVMAGTERREMYSRDLIHRATTDCTYQSPHFLARLATISQINLLDPKAADAESDTIIRITTQETLLKNHHPSSVPDSYTWSVTPDAETLAKEWSLKCLVNFLRSHLDDSSFTETATPIYSILTRLVSQSGELSSSLHGTPGAQKSHLRLTASRLLLKLCSKRRACEDLITPHLFNTIALVAHDRLLEVRTGFTRQLKKYLAVDRLNYRWYAILFLSAFEPERGLRNDNGAWLKSRAQTLARKQQSQSRGVTTTSGGSGGGHQNIMELLFSRLLSLLAHHPDYPEKESESFATELMDFAQYILYYLTSVANEENLSLIFHVAQRVKQTQDAVTGTPEASERLYVLSDLAQAVIKHYADFISSRQKGHGSGYGKDVNLLQTWPGKLRLPLSLFKALPNHEVAQGIAERNYLPEEVAEALEGVVRGALKPGKSTSSTRQYERKRKSETQDIEEEEDDDAERNVKRSKKTAATRLPIRKGSKSTAAALKPKTPRPAKRKSEERPSSEAAPARKSSRKGGSAPAKSYVERDSEDDDKEMETWERMAETISNTRAVEKSEEDKGSDQEGEGGRDDESEAADGQNVKENGHKGEEMENEDVNVDDNMAEEHSETSSAASSRQQSPSPLHPPTHPSSAKAKAQARTQASSARKDSGGSPIIPKQTKGKKKTAPPKKDSTTGNVRVTRRTKA